jgi:23S rRNA (uracil1939-C5)-methyltransferase
MIRSGKIYRKISLKKYNKPVTIEKIVHGGLGLGRLDDGRVIMVGKVLPDEKVTVTITDSKKDYLYGEAETILEAHPLRRNSPCPWYGLCGGCDLQHCTYEEQLQIKTGIIRDLLSRQVQRADIELSPPVHDTLASPLQFGYRQRIRLQVDSNGKVGFLRFRSHQIVPIRHCMVAREELNAVLGELTSTCIRIFGHCRELELFLNPMSCRVVCLFHLFRKPRPADIREAEHLTNTIPLIDRIFFQGSDFPLTGPFSVQGLQTNNLQLLLPSFQDTENPIVLNWEVGGFCQLNLEQNVQLIDHILRISQVNKNESILDLFCGMGNFSIPLACRAASLLGIEGQGAAIRSARINSDQARLTNTIFQKGPIHQACSNLVRAGKVFDCVVLDPPRQGVPGLASALAALSSRRLVYISCDPATLCRDLADLTRYDFIIRHIQPIDMFPQTHHIETIAMLEKN